MINDFFTKQEIYDILSDSGEKLGIDIVTYNILKLVDTKNLDDRNTYSVTVKHRVLLSGCDWKAGGKYQSEGFRNYPMMLGLNSGIVAISDKNAQIAIKKIFPKTINANVEQNSNHSTGTSKTQTNQTSSGSSSSNVNTFGVSISAGFFGELPTGSIGVDYSHGWESGRSQSASQGSANARDIQSTSGNEMSVKDWSAYASVENFKGNDQLYMGEFVRWNWGQTFPWNVFDYSVNGSGTNILLPESVVANLLYYGESNSGGESKNILLPPSDLSLFGLDFTMAAEWQVTFPTPLTSTETLQFQHQVEVIQGSHSMKKPAGEGQAELLASLKFGHNTMLKQADPISIAQYALVPLADGRRNGMGIGFQPNLFDIAPANASTPFKIRSRGNDVLVTGQGFDASMTAPFAKGYSGTGATMTVAFKVADVNTQYSLVLKHWKGSVGGNIRLNCTINGNLTVLNVADLEGQGSMNNLSQLDLRNFDLKSSNFHDYLTLGWNEIAITILPADPTVASTYAIAALSIE